MSLQEATNNLSSTELVQSFTLRDHSGLLSLEAVSLLLRGVKT